MSMFTDLSKLSKNDQKEINQLASLITKFKSTILAVNARHRVKPSASNLGST